MHAANYVFRGTTLTMPRINSRVELPVFYIVLLCFTLCGCGKKTSPPPEQNEIANQAKALVKDFVESTKANPKNAANDAAILLESLEALANDFGEPYVALLEQGRVVEQKYQSKAPKAEIEAELAKLQELASGTASSE